MSFTGLLITQDASGRHVQPRSLTPEDLPEGSVRLALSHSSLNYKDALALTGRAPVVRHYPMIPGIDGVGTVLESQDPRWPVGARALVNGWGLGETRWGCYAQQLRVPGDWLVAVPERFSPEHTMAIGTAGYTAMLCVLALEQAGIQPTDGPVLVTGATGGVGSVAIALLSALGYAVTAVTGKTTAQDYLHALGAQAILPRSALSEPGKPLQKEQWAGVIDSVGGQTLANACAQTRYGGVVAACGLAQSADLPLTVMPFILRGVRLSGVDSVMAPHTLRAQAWARLAQDLPDAALATLTIGALTLETVVRAAEQLLAGQHRGRQVVTL